MYITSLIAIALVAGQEVVLVVEKVPEVKDAGAISDGASSDLLKLFM